MSGRLPSDDTDLIRLAASCDDSAFCEVVRRFNPYIASVLRRYAARIADREDLRSEILTKLLANSKRALRAWEPRASFGTYVATIAARHCMDWLRRNRRLPQAALGGDGDNGSPDHVLEEIIAADAGDEPQELLQNQQRHDSLREAIEGLSSDDRLVLYLRFDQDLSGVEISEMLGISHGAARQRLFRAVRRLEDRIEEVCPEVLNVKRY